MKISAILLAAGSGKRLKKSTPKAFVQISGREILLNSLEIFENSSEISETILVVPRAEISAAKKLATPFKKVSKIIGLDCG
jgi:2-C-methyl-D-erythritol 4-phosphate cytidylyltransferase